jgi:hypothetical protein
MSRITFAGTGMVGSFAGVLPSLRESVDAFAN